MTVKKGIKLAGNILTIFALILLVRRLCMMDVDFSFLLRSDRILWMSVLTILYGLHILILPFIWRLVLQITTGRKLPFLVVQKVSCKSNLLKYIPGNVFQYIGRNEIAVLYDLHHRDVVLSTILDIGANIIGVFLVSAACYTTGFRIGLQSLKGYLSWRIIFVVLICFTTAFLILYIKRASYWDWLKRICTGINAVKYGACVAYYIFSAIYTGLIYYYILTHILETFIGKETAFIVVGAYLLSWLLGFLMPGAPGGVGVRETVIVALLAAYVPPDPVLLAIILYRIVNIAGDFLAFAVANIICLCANHKVNGQKGPE